MCICTCNVYTYISSSISLYLYSQIVLISEERVFYLMLSSIIFRLSSDYMYSTPPILLHFFPSPLTASLLLYWLSSACSSSSSSSSCSTSLFLLLYFPYIHPSLFFSIFSVQVSSPCVYTNRHTHIFISPFPKSDRLNRFASLHFASLATNSHPSGSRVLSLSPL